MSAEPRRVSSLPVVGLDVGVYGPDEPDRAAEFLVEHGFVVVRGLFGEDELVTMTAECERAQARVSAGELPERYGTSVFLAGGADEAAGSFAYYVTHLTEVAPSVLAAVTHQRICELMDRWLGSDCWLLDDTRFGVVYQDARPGPGSSYSRIGWHADWQSGPDLDIWPSVAFTFHLDGTGPENGFLRVVPGSHRWQTPAPHDNANGVRLPEGSRSSAGYGDEPPPYPMPLSFENLPGEIGLYAARGDVLFHDAYLWHAAARGTEDRALRRHIRGSWYTGTKPPTETVDRFVKNAAR